MSWIFQVSLSVVGIDKQIPEAPVHSTEGFLFMWEFGWGSFAGRGAAGAARHCFLALSTPPYRLDEIERKGSRHSRSA